MHTRPNVYMEEVLLGVGGGKTAPKFHSSQHYHQSATSINNQNLNSLNMRNRQRKWRVLLSIGLLLPALAAIIGIVAWTISIEVASANEAIGGGSSQKSQNHQNHHHHHSHSQHQHHHHSHHSQQQQQQPSNQNEQPNKRHLQQQQPPQQQPSIALPQQAAETKSESQACATLVLTNLKQQQQQQLDLNSDNIENRASKVASDVGSANDETSSYETDDQAELERDQQQKDAESAASANQSNDAKPSSPQRQQQQQQQQQQPPPPPQQDDDSGYEAIASAISTTLKAGGNNSPADQPSSSSALLSKSAVAETPAARRTTGENVADVIDHIVSRRRQASTASAQKGRPNVRASRIVVVAPIDDSMRARSQTKEVERPASSDTSSKEAAAGSVDKNPPATREEEEASDSVESEPVKVVDTERRSSEAESEAETELGEEVAIDRGDWAAAWPLRRELRDNDDLSIHVSSQPKQARARSRRQEIEPSLSFERIASLNKQQQQLHKASGDNAANQLAQQQQQPKLYSTEQIIRDHVMKSKSRNSSQPVGENNEKQSEQNKMMTPPPQTQQQQQQQQQPEQPRQQRPHDASRQQQQYHQQSNALWLQQQHHLARIADGQQHHSFRPQPNLQQFHDMMSSSSQQHQVPQFFLKPNDQFNAQLYPNPSHNSMHHPHPQPHFHQRHLQPHQPHNQLQQHGHQPAIHTTEHHFLLSPSQFQNFMNSPLFQQQPQPQPQSQPQPQQVASRRQQVASSRNSVEPVAPPVGVIQNKPPQGGAVVDLAPASGAMRAMRSLVTSQVQQPVVVDQETQGSEIRSMRYLTNGPGGAPVAADGSLVISEQQQQEAAAALASAGSEPRPQIIQHHPGEAPVADQEVQESYGQMPAYQMAEGYGGGGHQYHHGGGGGYQSGDQDKKSKGITFHFGGGPIGGGTQLITSPMGIFKHLMIPLLPNPRVNLNGKVVFGVVLEKSTAFGSPPKKKKYKFWGR